MVSNEPGRAAERAIENNLRGAMERKAFSVRPTRSAALHELGAMVSGVARKPICMLLERDYSSSLLPKVINATVDIEPRSKEVIPFLLSFRPNRHDCQFGWAALDRERAADRSRNTFYCCELHGLAEGRGVEAR